jgi:DNA helicase II / ATP-dependent DNA helicase PcrA
LTSAFFPELSSQTRVLTHRLVYLLKDLAPQSSIVALTFSNKAQQEMRNRVDELNPSNLQAVQIYTFHSFCSKILRTYGRNFLADLVSNPSFSSNFSTLDEEDSLRIITGILKKNQLDTLDVVDTYRQIMKSKENIALDWGAMLIDQPITRSKSTPLERLLSESYERELRESNAADFCDLLVLAWRLLREYPVVRAAIQGQYQHILIDEYQDTNLLQYEITKLLYQPPPTEALPSPLTDLKTFRSLFVVGDSDQSIYSWRGALPENLSRLTHDFKGCSQFELKHNYRSSPNILAVANAVLGSNSTIPPPEKPDLGHLPVYVYGWKDERTQAEFICRSLKSMTGKSRAILFRTNAQSHVLEVCLPLPDLAVGSCCWLDRTGGTHAGRGQI